MKSNSQRLTVVLVALLILGAAMWYWARTPSKHPVAETTSQPAESSKSFESTPNSSSASLSSDYSTLLDAALREPNPTRRSIDFSAAFARWFAENPDAALAYLKGMPQGAECTQAMFYALQSIAKTDPQKALLLARDMATTHEQKFIYSALFSQISASSIDSALNFLELVPAGEARENALRALAAKWSDRDVGSIMKWAQDLSDPDERSAALETTLAVFAKRNPQQTLSLAQEFLTGAALDRVLTDAVKQLAVNDPQAAAAFVSQMPPGDTQKSSTLTVARALAMQDTDAAIMWVKGLPEGDTAQLALNNILDVWAKKDIAAASQYVAQMPTGVEQDAAATHLAQTLGEADPELAIQWIGNLPSDSARNAATVQVVSGWARQSPVNATQWATALPAESTARADAIGSALSYWVMADASAAGKYVQSLPDADAATAIKSVAPTLAQNDIQNALNWAQNFSSASSRQIALNEVLARWKENQPEEAAHWAQVNQ